MVRRFLLLMSVITVTQENFNVEAENVIVNKPSKKSQIVIDDLSTVREELLKKENLTPQMCREASNAFFMAHSGKKEEVRSVEDFRIPALDGFQIIIRKYIPIIKKSDFIVLYAHGGGWMQGNLETHDYLCRKITNSWEAEVLAVDYRLAPEYPFPIPLNDFFDSYKWCVETFPDKKIVIAGDSAGGNLCAALCVKIAKEKYKKIPYAQVLIYPAISSNLESPSFEAYGDLATLTKLSTANYTSQYIGKPYNDPSAVSNPYIYPLGCKEVSVFPKTILIPAECDVLLDSQLELEKRLKETKIPIFQIHTKGTVHGFMMYGKEFEEEVSYVLEQAKSLL